MIETELVRRTQITRKAKNLNFIILERNSFDIIYVLKNKIMLENKKRMVNHTKYCVFGIEI